MLRSDETPDGRIVTPTWRASAPTQVLRDLHEIGVHRAGMVALDPIDAAFGALVDRAEKDAPGEAADAVIWDELTERIDEDATLTWTFLGFMVLATLLAAIGVVTDSSITIVGAMVVGPEFGPLAGLAVALVRRRAAIARLSATALLVGFAVAIVDRRLAVADRPGHRAHSRRRPHRPPRHRLHLPPRLVLADHRARRRASRACCRSRPAGRPRSSGCSSRSRPSRPPETPP